MIQICGQRVLMRQATTIRVAFCAAGPFARTTMEFAAVPDHVRLPGRFFGRFTTAASAVDPR